MFTGLIEAVCTVKSVSASGEALLLTVELGKLAGEIKIGDSVAINGACLTATKLTGNSACFDVSGETLSKTTVGKLRPSAKVNVELAMKSGARFGGHFVQGHIDGTAKIKAIQRTEQFAEIELSADEKVLGQMVEKGSVAVNGISLTVTSISKDGFKITVIPQTLENTTLGKTKIGDEVNIETDIIVKTVKMQLSKILPQSEKLTIDKLKQMGF